MLRQTLKVKTILQTGLLWKIYYYKGFQR